MAGGKDQILFWTLYCLDFVWFCFWDFVWTLFGFVFWDFVSTLFGSFTLSVFYLIIYFLDTYLLGTHSFSAVFPY